MEINKEYLEDKLKQLVLQKNKVKEQINNGVVIINQLDGAIDVINVLLKDLNKK